MRERGDLTCLHEPFMYDYYVNRKVREMPHFDFAADHPITYQDIRNMILAMAKDNPVFFKDMSYYVMPHIFEDQKFLERVTHCFLIRNPLESILSYYKLDPEVSLEEIGLEAQWKHFDKLTNLGLKPLVIEAETVRNDTKNIISELWKAIDIPYEDKAFDWQNDKPDDWNQVSGWHGSVICSKGIKSIPPDEQEKKKKEFYSLAKTAPQLLKYLSHHYPFYEQLRKTAIDI